jgi:group I intron endonuclease
MKTINEKTNTKIPGIYEIINLVNNKKYIGQSVDIRTRLNKHKSSLKHNRHHNSHLQAAYNKYGADNFRFNIIESNVSINSLDTLERYYIYIFKATNSDYGYNIENGGHEGKKLSEEHKAKIGAANKRLSDEDRTEHMNKLIKDRGFKNYTEYRNELAKNRGFKSHAAYQKKLANDKGFKNKNQYFEAKKLIKAGNVKSIDVVDGFLVFN